MGRQTHVVDLRSDVLTQPTPEMRRIISEAQLGDDVFEECTVTNGELTPIIVFTKFWFFQNRLLA